MRELLIRVNNMKVLILGVTGMLGNILFKQFLLDKNMHVLGTLRDGKMLNYFPPKSHSQLITNVDILDYDSLTLVLEQCRPDVVINCIGYIKQLKDSDSPLLVLPINSIFPHRLARLCSLMKSRLILISTDCVYTGTKGMYVESDVSNAEDLYGKSKFIGEVHDMPNVVTLRTSIIGHELKSNHALVDWFLSQTGTVKGYAKAVFSGLPTIELANIIQKYVISNSKLSGLFHVSTKPINKLSLLQLVADTYQKDITIIPDEKLCIDRSLNSELFRDITGYLPPEWPELISSMYDFQQYN